VRLVDLVIRHGHLSERALIDACTIGDRPAHLDRCDLCAARAVELARWLDEVRTLGLEDADAAFPAERLAAQETQILRRLEQIDRPARVIAFPAQARYERLDLGGRGIRPAWIGIAAAAGLVLGVFGGQVGARFFTVPPSGITAAPPPAPIQTAEYISEPPPASLQDLDESGVVKLPAIEAYDTLTPHITQVGMRQTRQK
jgi:hypothetical protein